MYDRKTLHLADIGEILLEKSARAKHINITVKPSMKVRVAVPLNMSFSKGEELACKKADWISSKLEKFKSNDRIRLNDMEPNLKKEHEILDRVAFLAEQFNFQYNRVTFKNMTSRWGSCSHQNNISLNRKMIFLPNNFRDYIILHELLHTKIKNHEKYFWSELEKMQGGARKLHKTINHRYLI